MNKYSKFRKENLRWDPTTIAILVPYKKKNIPIIGDTSKFLHIRQYLGRGDIDGFKHLGLKHCEGDWHPLILYYMKVNVVQVSLWIVINRNMTPFIFRVKLQEDVLPIAWAGKIQPLIEEVHLPLLGIHSHNLRPLIKGSPT